MKTSLFVAIAVIVTVAVTAAAAYVWFSAGDIQMSGHGWAALVLGTVLSLGVGGGLMALVFISARRGYDDAAHYSDDDGPL